MRPRRWTPTNPGNYLKMPESGFKPWRPHLFFEGWKDGEMVTSQGYRNTLTDEEYCPPEGWNGDPPARDIGDLSNIRHSGGSDEFWAAMAAAKDNPLGKVILQKDGRTVLRY